MGLNYQEKYETLKEMMYDLHCPDLVERFWGVSLHVPKGELVCTYCSNPDDAYPTRYPCDTIQNIIDLEEGDE